MGIRRIGSSKIRKIEEDLDLIKSLVQKTDTRHKSRIPERLFTEKEAAAYLGRTVSALREIRYAGNIPFVQYQRSIRYDISDLDTWIEKNKTCFKND